MLITISTIGYGDMYVRATLSRIIIFFCAIYGAVVFPLLIVTLTNIFEVNDKEDIIYKIVEMIELKRLMKKQGAKIIGLLLQIKHHRQRNSPVEKLIELDEKM